jgi:pilus assembly protein Flp/PilA
VDLGRRTGRSAKGGVQAMRSRLRALIDLIRRNDAGQGLVEYGLILVLIAIVAIVALIFIGTQLSTTLSNIGSSV